MLDGVAAHELADGLVGGRWPISFVADLLGVRPGAVGVRVVGLERDVVDADFSSESVSPCSSSKKQP